MGEYYKTTAKLNKEESKRLKYLQATYQIENLSETMTVTKAISRAINDAYDAMISSQGKPRIYKKAVTPKKDELSSEIARLFEKSDGYISSQTILEELGLPSSDGRKLAVAMKKIEIVGKKIKTGKVYFCQLK